MSSEFGKRVHISIFGESHGPAIGVLIGGLPAGERIDLDALCAFLARRAPGCSPLSTPRKERDIPEFLSGITDGKTNGAPIAAIIRNDNARSADYDAIRDIPRPSHADYTAYLRYQGHNDVSGGGHLSGRLTAPLCVAGGICLQLLARRGVTIGAHIASVGAAEDTRFDPVHVSADLLMAVSQKPFPAIDDCAAEAMQREIEDAKRGKDSVGTSIECCAVGFLAGIGTPMFDGIENRLARVLFGIPAVKGVEFGAGFGAARMRGSAHNDPFYMQDGRVLTRTNHHGGILGGISSGMPIVFRVGIKPTPSIALEQDSVSLSRCEDEKLTIEGRHDPCIALRAVPCVEAAAGAVLLDMMLCEQN